MSETDGNVKPRFPIRRFDVFAEYNRVKNVADGMSAAVAKGRGLWVAKVVAGRGAGSVPAADAGSKGAHDKPHDDEHDKGFRSIGGVEQTDAMFDREIVNRMGEEFYQQVFCPAIEDAFNEGKQYTEIRDAIRKSWK